MLWSQQLAIAERDILADPWRRLSGASPSYADGVLVCPTSTGAVVAVDLATRSLLWGYRYDRQSSSSMQANMLLMQMRLMGYHTASPTGHWLDASVSIAGGRVLLTPLESDALHCLNLADGKLLWKLDRQDELYVACVHRDNVVLVGPNDVRAVSMSETTEQTKTVQIDPVDGSGGVAAARDDRPRAQAGLGGPRGGTARGEHAQRPRVLRRPDVLPSVGLGRGGGHRSGGRQDQPAWRSRAAGSCRGT